MIFPEIKQQSILQATLSEVFDDLYHNFPSGL